jgi:sigma-E factor negative regulatory protein RseB
MAVSVRHGGPGATICAAGTLLLSLLALSARGADDPRAWLARMGEAMDTLSYEGTLVHVHGDHSDVFELVHRVDSGHVTERLTSRDDAGREIIRDGNQVTCIFPDRREVVVEQRDELAGGPGPLREHLPQASEIDEAHYHVAFRANERLIGREARIVQISPKDSWRYGYRIWLDLDSAMPLKTELRNDDDKMLEQVRFITIKLQQRIPKAATRPTVTAEAFTWQRSSGRSQGRTAASPGEWQARRLPPGFRLMERNERAMRGFPAGLRQVVYTDGLASVSVFIEMAVAASEQAEGVSQLGAANAFTTTTDGHMVTAVGEVPVRTVELIATSMGLNVRPAP